MGKSINYIDNFKKQFEEYLNSIGEIELGDETKKSYVSYMMNISSILLDKFVKDYLQIKEVSSFIELFYRLNRESRVKLLVLVENYIDKYLKKSNLEIKQQTGKTKKTIQNYRSGFRLFTYMGYDYSEKAINTLGKSEKNIINGKYKELDCITYTKKELDRVYLARLKTQDRSYNEIMFPIRVIWKFAKKHSMENRLLTKMQERLDEMIYYTSSDGDTIQHKNIKKLVLNLSEEYVEINKEKMFTEIFRAGRKELQKPIMASISIDHAKSLHKLLSGGNEKRYEKLIELSNKMQNYQYTCKKTKAAEAIEFFNAFEEVYDYNFVRSLVNEVCELFSNMDFVAMDKAENSRKNDNV